MSFKVEILSSVFDNPDLLREIGLFIEPRLPMYFVFHAAREAFHPLEKTDENGSMVILSTRWKFCYSTSMLEWLLDNFDDYVESFDRFCECLVRAGCLEVIKWFISKKFVSPNDSSYLVLLNKSSKYNHIEILQYLCSNYPNISNEYINSNFFLSAGCCYCTATSNGSLEAIKLLRSLDDPMCFCYNCPLHAAKIGNLEVLQLIYQTENFRPNNKISMNAAEGGHIHILSWLRSLDPPCPLRAGLCCSAAGEGQLNTLQWLRSQDPPCPWDNSVCFFAARNGHMNVLEWARSQDPPAPWNESVCYEAVCKDRLDILQWLRAQNPPCGWNAEKCCLAAAERCNLGILEYLKELNPTNPWNVSNLIFNVVIKSKLTTTNNKIAAMHWLRSQDPPCPWDHNTLLNAIKSNDMKIIQWLRSQNPPCPWSEKTCAAAARGKDVKVLKWLRAQDPPCPWDEETCINATNCLEVLKWVRSQIPPCPWDHRCCLSAIRKSKLNVLVWLREQNPPCPWKMKSCLEWAKKTNNFYIADWIENYS